VSITASWKRTENVVYIHDKMLYFGQNYSGACTLRV